MYLFTITTCEVKRRTHKNQKEGMKLNEIQKTHGGSHHRCACCHQSVPFGLIGSAEVQELMNDTFESGYGAWKGVGSSLSLSTEQAHNGGTSLYCYDRTANWGAPAAP